MRKEKLKLKRSWRRSNHSRSKLKTSSERPRLSVYRSNKHINCQIVDDLSGKTLVSAGSRDKDVSTEAGGNCEAAAVIGKTIAEKAIAAGISQVAFDRGHYKYHGRIAALAEAAREAGLKF
jgi:large subunit ribosomal protein L18